MQRAMDWARVLPIFVQFGGGALLCAVGVWAGLTSGYVDTSLRNDRRALAIVVAGYVGLLVLACVFTLWLPTALPEPTP